MQCLPNNHCSAQSSVRNDRAEKSRRASGSARSGIAIMWLIAAAPAVLIMLCVMVEVGHIWNARVKLEVALESAALAGVKTWADLTEADNTPGPHDSPGEFSKTSAARDAAVAAAAANTISGVSIALDRNEQDDGIDDIGYDNASCTGDLLLGGFPTTGGTDFNVTAAVGCGRSTMSTQNIDLMLDITIDTAPPGGGGPPGDTSTVPSAFTISWTSTDPQAAGFTLTRVVIDLQWNENGTLMPPDNGLFQPLLAGPTTLTMASPGTFNIPGAGAAARNANDALGNGPALYNPGGGGAQDSEITTATFTFSDPVALGGGGTGYSTLTIDLPVGEWTDGEQLVFGVDTDLIDGDSAPQNEDEDNGGDFGEAGAASGNDPAGRVAFFIGFNGGAESLLDFVLQPTGQRARIVGKNLQLAITITIIVPDEDYAVLAQQTLQVNSICSNLFGIPIGPFTISGRAVATARCAGANSTIVNNPLLVHITGTTCH